MCDRTAIMTAAWARYRNVVLPRFCRERFRTALRVSWTAARAEAAIRVRYARSEFMGFAHNNGAAFHA